MSHNHTQFGHVLLCMQGGTKGMTRSYDTGQLLANHLGGHHLEKAHGI